HAQRPPSALVDPTAARALWYAIVSRHSRDLLNPRGAARRAADAWAMFHAWRNGGETLRRAVPAGLHEDPAVFVEWAERYRSRLEALHAIDAAQLPDMLTGIAD